MQLEEINKNKTLTWELFLITPNLSQQKNPKKTGELNIKQILIMTNFEEFQCRGLFPLAEQVFLFGRVLSHQRHRAVTAEAHASSVVEADLIELTFQRTRE